MDYFRSYTNDYRLATTDMERLLFPNEKPCKAQREVLRAWALELGAECLGKARVNTKTGERRVDEAFAISAERWPDWLECMQGRASVPNWRPGPKERQVANGPYVVLDKRGRVAYRGALGKAHRAQLEYSGHTVLTLIEYLERGHD